jgi:hypothetical protein
VSTDGLPLSLPGVARTPTQPGSGAPGTGSRQTFTHSIGFSRLNPGISMVEFFASHEEGCTP